MKEPQRSPAINNGRPPAYDYVAEFERIFGVDIAFDCEGYRTTGALRGDIGSYEVSP